MEASGQGVCQGFQVSLNLEIHYLLSCWDQRLIVPSKEQWQSEFEYSDGFYRTFNPSL